MGPSNLSASFTTALDPREVDANPFKDPMILDDESETHDDSAPSRQDLLQRAAVLGPVRLTYASMAFSSTDPILGEKMQPRVAERRARFRKVVKVTLGACLGFCVIATAATALSSGGEPTKAAAKSPGGARTVPATGVVLVEKIDFPELAKAPGRVTAAARARATPIAKKRR